MPRAGPERTRRDRIAPDRVRRDGKREFGTPQTATSHANFDQRREMRADTTSHAA